mgnify:CR=1 FL=1
MKWRPRSALGGRVSLDDFSFDAGAYAFTSTKVLGNGLLASLGQLAAAVAHEINNPLASIAGYAEAARSYSRMAKRKLPNCSAHTP